MKKRAFSLVEALIALSLISLALGIVAHGFAKLSKINTASEAASFKIELCSALHRLSSEVSGALTVAVPIAHQLDITRVDPSLNLTYDEARQRLPWPWPDPATLPAGVLEPNRAPFVVNESYRWVAASGSVVKQAEPLISGLADWQVRQGSDNRLLELEFFLPGQQRTMKITAYLPMVAP